jgi:hypothetical protein
MKTVVAAGVILAAFALPAFADTGSSVVTGSSKGYLLSFGGGVPLPVGDYNSQVDPSFSIPVELNASLKHHIGWTAIYAFNRLQPSDEVRAESASEGKTSKDSDVNHLAVGPAVTERWGRARGYANFTLGADSVGPYEQGGDRNTYFAMGGGAAFAYAIHGHWDAVAQVYTDSFKGKDESTGNTKWSSYLQPGIVVAYAFGSGGKY